MFVYCGNNPVMNVDPTGYAPEWLWNVLNGIGIIVGTALFVTAIIASAGAVGALAGVGAAAIGLSAGAVSATSIIATIGTYVVATGVGVFGLSDSIEMFSGGINPIRDYIMGGNQIAYDITHGFFNALGTIAILAGSLAPKILQKSAAKYGTISREGHVLNFFDSNGNWSARIDATVHGNSKWHHNPHLHLLDRTAKGKPVYYFWNAVWRFLGFK